MDGDGSPRKDPRDGGRKPCRTEVHILVKDEIVRTCRTKDRDDPIPS